MIEIPDVFAEYVIRIVEQNAFLFYHRPDGQWYATENPEKGEPFTREEGEQFIANMDKRGMTYELHRLEKCEITLTKCV